MPHLTSHEAARWTRSDFDAPEREADGIVADSRLVRPGVAFAAVRGGHAYVRDALEAGAPFAIVDQAAAAVPDATIVVGDVIRALGVIAAEVRKRLAIQVVGITGSTGKTLTKDFVNAALGASFRVHSAPASYNNELGLPLVVLSCPDDAEVMVAELGARRPGEIADLCEIVKPRTGLITGIGVAHIEIFGTREAIATTKAELLGALPGDGLAIIPSNDDFTSMLARATSARVTTVGPGAHIRYRANHIDGDGRTHGEVFVGGRIVPVTLPVPGRPLMRNAAIAIAVAVGHGVDPGEAAMRISRAAVSDRRVEIIRAERFTIVNDAFNANPTSTVAALRTTHELAGGREKWAVLGEMAELGPISEQAHERVGRIAHALGYAGLITVGEGARTIADAAPGIAVSVPSIDEAFEAAVRRTPRDAVVLVKASRAVGLERLVERLRSWTDPAQVS